MRLISSIDLAIASALKAGTLSVYEREGRFGAHGVIADHVGIIETPDSLAAATDRVEAIRRVVG